MNIKQEMIDFAQAQNWDDDVRQDVYVILLEKAEGYMGDVSTEQLMTSIYNLRCLNGYRQDSRRRELMQENISAIEGFHGTDDNWDPIEYLEADAVLTRVNTLSPLLRKTLYAYLNGVSMATMAKHEDMDVNSIYQRMYTIKKELQHG